MRGWAQQGYFSGQQIALIRQVVPFVGVFVPFVGVFVPVVGVFVPFVGVGGTFAGQQVALFAGHYLSHLCGCFCPFCGSFCPFCGYICPFRGSQQGYFSDFLFFIISQVSYKP